MSVPALSRNQGSTGNKIPKGYSSGRLQQFTPEQVDVFKNQMSFVSPGSQLSQMAQGNDLGFAPHEDYARRQFQEATSGLASQFSGLGMGARRGSGFQNQATQGAQDFASMLARQRQGLQRQALGDLMGLSNSILGQRPYEQFLTKQEQPFWKQLLLGATSGVSNAAGSLFGGLMPWNKQQQPQQQSGVFQPASY